MGHGSECCRTRVEWVVRKKEMKNNVAAAGVWTGRGILLGVKGSNGSQTVVPQVYDIGARQVVEEFINPSSLLCIIFHVIVDRTTSSLKSNVNRPLRSYGTYA